MWTGNPWICLPFSFFTFSLTVQYFNTQASSCQLITSIKNIFIKNLFSLQSNHSFQTISLFRHPLLYRSSLHKDYSRHTFWHTAVFYRQPLYLLFFTKKLHKAIYAFFDLSVCFLKVPRIPRICNIFRFL